MVVEVNRFAAVPRVATLAITISGTSICWGDCVSWQNPISGTHEWVPTADGWNGAQGGLAAKPL